MLLQELLEVLYQYVAVPVLYTPRASYFYLLYYVRTTFCVLTKLYRCPRIFSSLYT